MSSSFANITRERERERERESSNKECINPKALEEKAWGKKSLAFCVGGIKSLTVVKTNKSLKQS